MTDDTGVRQRRVSDIPLRADFVDEIQTEQRLRDAARIVRDIQTTLRDYRKSHPHESTLTVHISSHDPRYAPCDLHSLAAPIRSSVSDLENTGYWLTASVNYRYCWWGMPRPLCGLPPRHLLTVVLMW